MRIFFHARFLRYNPTWNEAKFLLVNSLTDNLVLTVMDYNEVRKDTEIGATLFELAKLDEDSSQEDLSLPILKDGKEKGELRFDVLYFPVLKSQVNQSGVEELPESSEFGALDPHLRHTHNHTCRCGRRPTHASPGQRP